MVEIYTRNLMFMECAKLKTIVFIRKLTVSLGMLEAVVFPQLTKIESILRCRICINGY